MSKGSRITATSLSVAEARRQAGQTAREAVEGADSDFCGARAVPAQARV